MNNQAQANADPGRRITVLHIVQALRGGGGQTFVRELVPCLAQRGIDAQILCAYGKSQLTEKEAAVWSGAIYSQERSGVSRLHYLKEMRRLVRQSAPDIVHTHLHVGAFWGRAAAMLERAPIIVHTEHSSAVELAPLERAAAGILNRRTHAIVTFSERAAEIARRRENIRDVRVIPNGIRVRPRPSEAERRNARMNLGVEANHVVVGMVTSLSAHKNPALAIDAIARLPERTRHVIQLAYFGDGPLQNDLMARVKNLGLESLVRFYGFRADLEELLPGLDLMLSTSPAEMMPMSYLEAMNAALPIIGTPHAGTLDLVVDGVTGLVVRSWDAQAVAESIEWAVAHPEWRFQAGNSSYERLKENFDIETVADQYVDLYQHLLSRNRPHGKRPLA